MRTFVPALLASTPSAHCRLVTLGLLPLMMSACDVGQTLNKFVQPPVVAMETPIDGSELAEAVPVLMRGRVTDEAFEKSLSTISATWAINGGRACEGAVFDVNGISECEAVFERGDATVSLTAVNPDGQTASAVVELVIVKNDAPTANIVSPTDDVEYYANQLTLFEGEVADGEDPGSALAVEWKSSIDGVLAFDSGFAGDDGKTNGSMLLSTGEHQITLTVTDSTGRTGSDTTTIDVAVGSKPEIELITPVNGDVANLDEIVYFEAVVSDYEDDPENLILSWESDLDGVFSTQSASSSGSAEFSDATLSRGTHNITVYATDSDGMTAQDSVTLYINGAPEAPEVRIDPDPVDSNEALSAVIDTPSYDPDGDAVSYSYEWYLNGVVTSNVTNPLAASETTRGQVWTVYVYPNDGKVTGPYGTDSITIGNSPPEMVGLAVTPATPYTDDTLSAAPIGFYDDDGDPEGWRYQWTVNGVDVFGATEVTLGGNNFVRGDVVTVTVWPNDGREDGASMTSAPRTIENSTPTVPIVNVTPDNPEREDSLTCTPTSTDTDQDSISYTYAWTKDGAPTAETGSTVDASLTENGEVWACWVTATDGTATSASGSDSVTIADYVNVPPEAPTIHIDPDPALSEQYLSVIVDVDSYDLDGDTVSYSYEWYRDGVITAVTGTAVPASETTKGETWTVVVTPNDGNQNGTTESASVLILNTPPTVASVSIEPTTAYTNDILTAVPSGWYDDDTDTEAYRYQWYIGGLPILGATNSTLAETNFAKNHVITVEVTPWDGTDLGITVMSGALTIQNSVPTAPGVSLTPVYPEPDDDLACSLDIVSVDADSDNIAYYYSWTVNGVPTGISSASVSASVTNIDETWVCSVSATDGTSTSAAGSDSVLVSDYTAPDAPVLDSLAGYRNEPSAVLTGAAEPFATITLYTDCGSGITSATGSANGAGSFSFAEALSAGSNCSFYATATDSYNNISPVSNVVSTEVCDPTDDYEDSSTYGESCADPVIDWSALDDDGATVINFTGNILDENDEDWYMISSRDLPTTGINYYRMRVELAAGSGEYAFAVYEGGCAATNLDCGSGSESDPEGTGYSEYEFYAKDVGGYDHGVPGDTRACYDSNGDYNNCEDLSSDYYIHVFRTTSGYSCQEYSIKVSNGIW